MTDVHFYLGEDKLDVRHFEQSRNFAARVCLYSSGVLKIREADKGEEK